jgi:drug/metabolite transporter (DMT)-like permease
LNAAAAGAALAAAFCYAFAATLQHRAARQEPIRTTLDPRLLGRLLRRPQWLVGGVADLTGAALHGTALVLGPLTLVQPLLVSGLILAVPLEAAFDRRRPARRDLAGVVLGGAGLATFVAVAQPQSGPRPPEDADLLGVAVAVGLFVAGLVTISTRAAPGWRGTLLGVAAGAGYALTATLAKAVLGRLADHGWVVLADWRLYALGVVGLASIVLNQNAFQTGPLAGPLTGIELTDPLASIIIGVTAYQERLATGGLRPPVELLAFVVMAAGVRLVSTRRAAVVTTARPVRPGPTGAS